MKIVHEVLIPGNPQLGSQICWVWGLFCHDAMGTSPLEHTGNLEPKLAAHLCSTHACSGDERGMPLFYVAIAQVVLLMHLRKHVSW